MPFYWLIFSSKSPAWALVTRFFGIHQPIIDEVIAVVIVFLSLTLNQPVNRWATIIVAAFFFVFKLIGLPTYPSAYDKFLIVVGLVFNLLTVWYAWNWV